MGEEEGAGIARGVTLRNSFALDTQGLPHSIQPPSSLVDFPSNETYHCVASV